VIRLDFTSEKSCLRHSLRILNWVSTYVVVGRGTVCNLSVSAFAKGLVHKRYVCVTSTLTGDWDHDWFCRVLEMHVVAKSVPVFTRASEGLRAYILGNLILEWVDLHLVLSASYSRHVLTVADHHYNNINGTLGSESNKSTYDCVCCVDAPDWLPDCLSSSLSIFAITLRSYIYRQG